MDPSSDSTRATFLLRLRNHRDQITWQKFHERYGELLYRYARRRGASEVDAEDIVQDVEMALLKALDGFEYDAAKGRFRSYLRSAVVHTMSRRANKQAKAGEPLDPQDFDHLVAAKDAEADDRWEREWQLHRLRWALREIAPEFNPVTLEAFRRHVLGGKTVDETAAELGLSKASVYQAKCRVLKSVKDRLDSLDPEGDI